MICNMGKIDRVIRLIIGLVVVAWGVMNSNIIAAAVGGVLLFTAIIGWCPLYTFLRFNSGCKAKDTSD